MLLSVQEPKACLLTKSSVKLYNYHTLEGLKLTFFALPCSSPDTAG